MVAIEAADYGAHPQGRQPYTQCAPHILFLGVKYRIARKLIRLPANAHCGLPRGGRQELDGRYKVRKTLRSSPASQHGLEATLPPPSPPENSNTELNPAEPGTPEREGGKKEVRA